MNDDALSELEQRYLETWTEPDATARRAAIERTWATDGQLVISPMGVTRTGHDDIAAHVAQVYEQNIAGRGMRFVYDQHATAGDAVLLRWSMLAPDGSAAGRGVDSVFLDADGRIRTVYMFMGID